MWQSSVENKHYSVPYIVLLLLKCCSTKLPINLALTGVTWPKYVMVLARPLADGFAPFGLLHVHVCTHTCMCGLHVPKYAME